MVYKIYECMDEKVGTFWRRTSKSVPGSITPVSGANHAQDKCNSTINTEAVEQVQHGDNDELILDEYNVKISRSAAESAAIQVLMSHTEQQKRSNSGLALNESVVYDEQSPSNDSVSTSPASNRSFGPGLGVRFDVKRGGGFCRLNEATTEHERLKVDKISALLNTPNISLDELREVCWSGVPLDYRPVAWKLLSGYLSPIEDRRQAMLERKRLEYKNYINQYYSTRHEDVYQDIYRQIHIDIPRMSPLIPLFQQSVVQELFERVLYIWAIRHPASGYVQGMNDLLTPFFVVFLREYLNKDVEIETYQLEALSSADLEKLEADCYWCFSKLLDSIQDSYTFAQPGIQIRVNSLKDLISRIDNTLHRHLQQVHVEYLQFAFRWMNNLLMREIPLRCVIRLWDTYLCETNGFASFHLYVCASFLTHFSAELQQEHDFHGLLVLLQNLPTQNWTDREVGILLADAYRLKYIFSEALKHLQEKNS